MGTQPFLKTFVKIYLKGFYFTQKKIDTPSL